MPYAEVVFNLPVPHTYTYRIPSDIELIPGMRVLVPFGRRTITGVVVDIIEKTKLTSLKSIIDVLDEKPLISTEMLQLTQWISDYYFSAWGQAIHLALPKGIDLQEKENIHLAAVDPQAELTERQRELYLIIGSNPGHSRDYYRKKFGQSSFYFLLSKLEERGLIIREKFRQAARVHHLLRNFVVISAEYSAIKEKHEDYLKYIKKRPEVDIYLSENAGGRILMTKFLKDTKMASATLLKMAGYKLCDVVKEKVQRKPQSDYVENRKEIKLTDEQHNCITSIVNGFSGGQFATFLLHGVTGSGKTQVYIEVLKRVLEKGKTAFILIPEISLTPQTVFRFRSIFGERVAVFHSKMSAGERFDAWMSCYSGETQIVVGPRSALFVPLKNIGLIVVDEEHETTYKQTDTAPRYHARDVAVYWAMKNKATVILGSATPSLESYFNARKGKYHLLEINNRVDNLSLPGVEIVDMKMGRKRIASSVSLFSPVLSDKISERLQKKEQIIILQNRRGYSSFMQCKNCGFIPMCANCDVTLTYHSFNEQLQCHFCGHKQPGFVDCPSCGGKQIVYKGIGTQRIQNELLQLFPRARILRMDQDTTRGKNRHETILKAFGDREADILLGTQMIAKGLDFSNVTLVGVISADVGLALPDFRAPERVFQLLTQVAGRAGRGEKSGEVIVQSYLFSHYAVQYARNHDYSGFYMEEVRHRQNFVYPPYEKLIQILVSAPKISNAIQAARTIGINTNKRAGRYCRVVGPAPAIIPKIQNLYRWQLILKLKKDSDPNGINTKRMLTQILQPYRSLKKAEIKVSVDVDPVSLA